MDKRIRKQRELDLLNLAVYSDYLGEFIKLLRERRGLTQEQVGNGGMIGKEAVGRIEREEKDPRWSTVLKVGKGLGLRPEEFLELFTKFLKGQDNRVWWCDGAYISEDGTERVEIWKSYVEP